jgi:hypothetical protein
MVKNEPLYHANSLQHNLKYVADVLDDNYDFKSADDLNRVFGTNLTFLDMLRIRLTIPRNWKQILDGTTEEVTQDEILYNRLNTLKTLKTKIIYWEILSKNHDCTSSSNVHINWMNYYGLDETTMKNYYTLPYKITRWTRLQALQYKILYKIINCNYWLQKIKIADSSKCRFCDKEETLMHFLFSCKATKEFWHAMLTWYNSITLENIDELTEQDIILGYIKNDNIPLNSCILIGKAMIYKTKNQNTQPNIYAFHLDFKEYISIESDIHQRNKSHDTFIDTWGALQDI